MTVKDDKEGVLMQRGNALFIPTIPEEAEQDDFEANIEPGKPIRTLSIGEKRIRSMVERFRSYVKDEPFQLWLPYTVVPTKLCRTTPFFIINKHDPEYGSRPYLEDYLVTETSWGRLTMSGLKLSVFDEDVLLALLYFINLTNKDKESQKLRVPPNSYSGKVRPILKAMGIPNPSIRDYKRLKRSIGMLYGATFSYAETRSNKSGTLLFRIFDTMYYEEPKDRKASEGMTFIHVTLSKEFLELAGGALEGTFLVMADRAKLTKQTSKALYRFMRSQKPGVLKLHIGTLRDALNMNPDVDAYSTKKELRRAIREMVDVGLLREGSGFTKANLCLLIKPGAMTQEEKRIQRETKGQLDGMTKEIAKAKTISTLSQDEHEWLVKEQARLFKELLREGKNPEKENFTNWDWIGYVKRNYPGRKK